MCCSSKYKILHICSSVGDIKEIVDEKQAADLSQTDILKNQTEQNIPENSELYENGSEMNTSSTSLDISHDVWHDVFKMWCLSWKHLLFQTSKRLEAYAIFPWNDLKLLAFCTLYLNAGH